MQNRFKEERHCLHCRHTFSEADLKIYQLASFYSLQYHEENGREAYPCTAMNIPWNSSKQPWFGMQCPFQYGSNISFLFFFFLFNSYQPFEQPNSQLPWSLGLNFFFLLSLWGKVDFYARLSKVLLFFDLQFRPPS